MITIIGSIVLIAICTTWIVGIILRELDIISDEQNVMLLTVIFLLSCIIMTIVTWLQ